MEHFRRCHLDLNAPCRPRELVSIPSQEWSGIYTISLYGIGIGKVKGGREQKSNKQEQEVLMYIYVRHMSVRCQ